MNFQIDGMTLRRDVDWSKPSAVVAYATVKLPDIAATLRGVMLAYTANRFTAYAPRRKDAENGLSWDANAPWAVKLGADLYDLYRRMGGEKPPGYKTKPDVVIKPKPDEIERRTVKATWTVKTPDQLDAALQRVDDHLAEHGGSLSDALAAVSDVPDISEMGLNIGVARTLGIAQ